MAVPSDYISGTITLTNGSDAFSGTDTGWIATDFREGDLIVWIEGGEDFAPPIIKEILTNTTGTLISNWAGPTLTNVRYRMRYQWDSSRVSAQSRLLIDQLGNGNITSFSALEGPGVPVFNGPHNLVIRPETDFINGVVYDVQVDTLADRAQYDGQAEGFAVLVSDVGDGRSALYSKKTNASGDWSDPAYITGETGPIVQIQAGNTSTLAPGQNATVTVRTIENGYALDLGVPRGERGLEGSVGATGPTGPKGDGIVIDATGDLSGRDAYDSEPEGFTYVDTDNGNLYFREGAAGNWSDPIPFGRGEKGEKGDTGDSGAVIVTTNGVGDGTTGPYILDATPFNSSAVWVSVNGLNQYNFTLDGNQITFEAIVPVGVPWQVKSSGPLSIAAPADGTVKASSLDPSESTAIRTAIGALGANSLIGLKNGYVDISLFGADPTGSTDSTTSVINAATYANENGLKLSCKPGRYLLSGTNNIPIRFGFDFSGGVFDVNNYKGYFHIQRTKQKVTYANGSNVVTGITSSSLLQKHSAKLSGWDANLPEVRNSFIRLNVDQDFVVYRENTQKRVELLRHFANGVLESGLSYSLVGQTITSAEVWPLEDSEIDCLGIVLDFSNTSTPTVNQGQFILVDRNNTNLSVNCIAPFNSLGTGASWITVTDSCSVNIKISEGWRNKVNTGFWNYCVRLDNCYDVTIEATSDGDGWGALAGGKPSRNITIKNSKVNRIDFHEGFFGTLKVLDTTLGEAGFTLLGFGDLYTERLKIVKKATSSFEAEIIKTRSDGAAVFDGSLTMRDTIVEGHYNGIQLFRCNANYANSIKPSGSPVDYRFFRNIEIDNLIFKNDNVHILNINPFNIEYISNNPFGSADNISIKGLKGWISINQNMTSCQNLKTKVNYSIFNSEVESLQFLGSMYNASFINFNAVGLVGKFGTSATFFETTFPGNYTFTGSELSSIDLFSGGAPTAQVNVLMNGGILRKLGSVPIVAGWLNANCDVRLNNVSIIGPTDADVRPAVEGLLTNPIFIVNNVRTTIGLSNDLQSASGGSYTLSANVRKGNKCFLITGFGGTPPIRKEFTMPEVSWAEAVLGTTTSTPPVTNIGKITRTSNTAITASGDILWRNIDIGTT